MLPREMLALMLHKSNNTELIHCMTEHGVDFIIIGGTALGFHGYRKPEQIDDLDLLIAPTMCNASRVSSALLSAHAGHVEATALARNGVQLPLKQIYWAELLTPPGSLVYESLAVDSERVIVQGLALLVASVPALIVLKDAAVLAGGIATEKHSRDLLALRARCPG